MRSTVYILAAVAALAAALQGCSAPGSSSSSTAPATPSCTGCHGSGSSAAPPVSLTGATATTDRAVGAHQAHLNPGPFRKAVACEECHAVPRSLNDPPHQDGKVDVTFGGLATSGGASATWRTATLSCAATYCHGATLDGGTNTEPRWTHVVGDGNNPASEVACGTCHAIPPREKRNGGKHPDIPAGFYPAGGSVRAACNACHPATVDANGDVAVAGGFHIDGIVEVGARGCTSCHGDPSPTSARPAAIAAAPPFDALGGTSGATTGRGVGAHQVHLTGTTLHDTPIDCTECHTVPNSLLQHPNPAFSAANRVVDVTWGPLARAGGAAPAWNGSVPGGTLSCSATYCHGGTLVGGTATAPLWTKVDGTQVTCTSCHGNPPDDAATTGTHVGKGLDCSTCHPGTFNVGSGVYTIDRATHLDGYVNIRTGSAVGKCTDCHGDAARAPGLAAAPPADTGQNVATTAHGVGAHMAHLVGRPDAAGVSRLALRAAPIACAECHGPVNTTRHATGAVDFAWGGLATIGPSYPRYQATAGGPVPAFTCSATYCHGSTMQGGTAQAPVWTRVDGSQMTCGSCHGNPPPAPHVQQADCGTCHTGYTNAKVNLALHLDGNLDVTGGACTTCHGDATRTPATIAAAPPKDAGPATAPWNTPPGAGAGAHLKHLVASALGPAIACAECHAPVATGDVSGTHRDGKADVVFGKLATTAGAAAAWHPVAAGTAPALSCSATYCHGATLTGGTLKTPVWNAAGGAASACGACHGVPPADGTHAGLTATSACSGCHAGYSATAVNLTKHLNGTIDASGGSCTSCHGDAARLPLTGADALVAAAPPRDAGTSTAPWAGAGTGAHLAHLNKGTGAIGRHVACNECHVVPASSAPSGTHINGVANVAFGTLSRTGGAAPTWNAATLGCAASWCHGNFGAAIPGGANATPRWTDRGPLSCTACHQNPPADNCHPPAFNHEGGNRCVDCHKNTNAAGTTINNINQHVDGIIQGKCSDCHRNQTRKC